MQKSVSLSSAELNQLLNRLIRIATDGEKGFAVAAADVRAPALKALLDGYSRQRSEFVSDLQGALSRGGSIPENEGTLRGDLHRGWLDVRLLTLGRSDYAVLEECLRGERAAKMAYEEALSHVSPYALPPGVFRMISAQYTAVVQALAEIRARAQKLASH